MKIACVADSLSRNAGGLFQSVRRLAQSLAEANSAVAVFGIEDQHTAMDLGEWAPLEVRPLPPTTFLPWGYSRKLLPALLKGDFDVLLAHGLWKYSSLASYRWHRATRKPYVIHPHGMLDPWAVQNAKWKKRVAYLAYERAHLASAACIRALCDAEARAIRAFGLRNKICVIPNGVDLPDLASVYTPPWSGEITGRRILLYLGRLHPKKNLLALLDAWKTRQTTSAGAREWMLVIAGWDQNNYEEQLRTRTRELGIEDSVHFAGPLFGEAKAAAYQNADAFVLPSLSEGLPMVVLEAWAHGKPVVMTPECNLPEGLAAGAALSTRATAAEIAETLGQLFEMGETDRKQMGDRGRALVEEKFLWPRVAEEMKQVCEWAIGGGAPPACVHCD